MSLYKTRLETLAKLIRYHANVYYREDRSEISDTDYDMLVSEYNQLIADHPELLTPELDVFKDRAVPIEDTNSEFEKVTHEPPMLSLDNVYSIEGYENWLGKLPEQDQKDQALEWKFDGIALRLVYEDGKLTQILTRGTGLEGENITENLNNFSYIPEEIEGDFADGLKIIIDGEGAVELDVYKELNDLLPTPYVTPRHAAAGISRNRKLGDIVAGSVTFIAHSFPRAIESDYESTMFALRKLGFKTSSDYNVPKITEERPSHIPFAIDGIVSKVRNHERRAELGETNHHPRWAIAFKFPTLTADPKLEDVVWETGRTGSVTPVATFTPVMIAGVMVQRATLHNFRTFQREAEGLRVGSIIRVGMAGDIIPQFHSVEKVGKGRQCKPPKSCPACDEPLRYEGGDQEQIFLTCTNHARCPAQTLGRLYNFGSKHGMNFRGLGPATIRRFHQLGYLNSFLGFFQLRELTQNVPLSKNEEKLLDEIDKRRTTTFARFITALGINGVGKGTARDLAEHIKDKSEFFDLMEDQNSLMEIPDIGWGISMNVASYVKENRAVIESLLDLLEFESVEVPKGLIPVVVTGKFPVRRNEITEVFARHGYEVTDRVNTKTKLVVLGDFYTKHKETSANELGIPVLSISVHPELSVKDILKEVQGRV